MTILELDPVLNCLPPDFNLTSSKTHVHLMGIGGVAMTSLAGLLSGAGCRVTGSDENLYSPMKEVLEELGLDVFQGYGADTLTNPDLVVVGNVVTRQFPVAAELYRRGLHYLSLPQALGQLFLNHTNNLVVAGCHGKTSMTNLAALIWEAGGLRPGYLIGGRSLDFESSFRPATGQWFVIEGDEYDSAFFNKVPKFIHYRPRLAILSSVEFDHADIYPDLEAVKRAYISLMELMPEDGRLLAFGDSPLVREVAVHSRAPVEFYGQSVDVHWHLSDFRQKGFLSSFRLNGPRGFEQELVLGRPGLYNCLNVAAVVGAFMAAGGDEACLSKALAGSKGVKRRQELVGQWGDLILIDDFAHHPTAVVKTLEAVRAAWPEKRILAAFEPRSNTSRRAIFQSDYCQALAKADLVFLAAVDRPDKAPVGNRLDVERLVTDLGPGARFFQSVPDLAEAIILTARDGDVIVVMSNGDFKGLVNRLAESFGQR